jgi:hypothetical protein
LPPGLKTAAGADFRGRRQNERAFFFSPFSCSASCSGSPLRPSWPEQNFPDAALYREQARQLWQHLTFDDPYRMPLYQILVALTGPGWGSRRPDSRAASGRKPVRAGMPSHLNMTPQWAESFAISFVTQIVTA